ncbi:hypothetical protein [Parachitinimonas caeni]|uniref:Uncharacterized protein n=1 Tax=Parachitinimonas caeni TaxID=3031301 RepID=A0ABT7DSA6_9NEIS|nr:hypothetical protein [Parachitinimonas caeni]MDK2122941.1 hypothetical protein [Parachitinimonas caeni]
MIVLGHTAHFAQPGFLKAGNDFSDTPKRFAHLKPPLFAHANATLPVGTLQKQTGSNGPPCRCCHLNLQIAFREDPIQADATVNPYQQKQATLPQADRKCNGAHSARQGKVCFYKFFE